MTRRPTVRPAAVPAALLWVAWAGGFAGAAAAQSPGAYRDRYRLEVRPAAVARAGLTLSSEVLKLARLVED